MKRTIVSMPGDGIGKTVLPEAIKVLDAVGFEAEYVHADIGWDFWCSEGNALPQRTIDLLSQHKIGLFGAITSKPKDTADEELSPALRGKGYTYFSPIVGMRQHFNLDICIRPCISFKGNPLNFIRKDGKGSFEEPLVNSVIFRQNTEGLYAGLEWSNPPANVRAAFESHPKWKKFKDSVINKDIKVYVTDISKHSIEWGKKHNKFDNIEFYHIDELDNIKDENVDLILLCEVYMQMEQGSKILKSYKDKFPNAKILVIHSVFNDNFKTKLINTFKRYIVKYTYLEEIQGRAMRDKEFKDELKAVGMKVEKEYDLGHLSRYNRVNNTVKAYLIS